MRACLLSLMLFSVSASVAQQPVPLDNRASDPRTLGWMQGSPPAADKVIRYDDGSYWTFPKLRWAFSNMQQIAPTLPIQRKGAPKPLPYALRKDIDGIGFTVMNSDKRMTWRESLDANYTDGIVVLHKGRIIYEYVFGGYDMGKAHIAASVTKSFMGVLAMQLIHESKLDPAALATAYVPELAGSGFADATVQQILDMTTALDYSENYVNPNEATRNYFAAMSWGVNYMASYTGPKTTYAALQRLQKAGTHGAGFTYRTPNSDALGWIVARAGGKALNVQLEERFWSKLGMERDAHIWVDSAGIPFAGGGMSLQLRDLARFGEMLRNNGKHENKQLLPAAIVAEIRKGADREKFKNGGYKTLPGWSYHNQFWVSHDDHGMFMARGVHGQMLYVNPKAELVIARFGSHPVAGNMAIDPTSLPAWRALAEHLIAKPR